MLWRPDETSLDPSECLWRRSRLAIRAYAWFVGVQPAGVEVTYELDPRAVTAYADGRVAGHAVLDDEGGVTITVAPEFADRGIEDELVVQATRIRGVRFR